MLRNKFLIAAIFVFLPALAAATPYYGATASVALENKEPPHLRGYTFTLFYDPQRFQWRKFNVYFDLAFAHFWDTQTAYYSSVSIIALSPVIRYTFRRRGPILTYLELSIGASYINHTRFEERNLGIHYQFQDRMGIGVLVGPQDKISIGLHAVHYSNAHIADHNGGITVPLMLDVGYRFC